MSELVPKSWYEILKVKHFRILMFHDIYPTGVSFCYILNPWEYLRPTLRKMNFLCESSTKTDKSRFVSVISPKCFQ